MLNGLIFLCGFILTISSNSPSCFVSGVHKGQPFHFVPLRLCPFPTVPQRGFPKGGSEQGYLSATRVSFAWFCDWIPLSGSTFWGMVTFLDSPLLARTPRRNPRPHRLGIQQHAKLCGKVGFDAGGASSSGPASCFTGYTQPPLVAFNQIRSDYEMAYCIIRRHRFDEISTCLRGYLV